MYLPPPQTFLLFLDSAPWTFSPVAFLISRRIPIVFGVARNFCSDLVLIMIVFRGNVLGFRKAGGNVRAGKDRRRETSAVDRCRGNVRFSRFYSLVEHHHCHLFRICLYCAFNVSNLPKLASAICYCSFLQRSQSRAYIVVSVC